MEKFLGLPPLASEHGAGIDKLIVLVHWFMLLLFIGWGIYYTYTLIRFRARKNPKAEYSAKHSHLSNYLEVGVLVVEVILLLGFSFPMWSARVKEFPAENESTLVRVVAEQFSWNIHYPGADGVFGKTAPELVSPDNPLGLDRKDPDAKDDITTVNQLNMPVGKPIIIRLSSKDVIHDLGIPVMRTKQDAVPGMMTPVWFTPTVVGNYEIACAQLCGLGHYRMRGYVNVMQPDSFKLWMREQEAALTASN